MQPVEQQAVGGKPNSGQIGRLDFGAKLVNLSSQNEGLAMVGSHVSVGVVGHFAAYVQFALVVKCLNLFTARSPPTQGR